MHLILAGRVTVKDIVKLTKKSQNNGYTGKTITTLHKKQLVFTFVTLDIEQYI